jgi:hypothetical protein
MHLGVGGVAVYGGGGGAEFAGEKPVGDSENFDVVVGRPGKFVGVQVKCTIFRSKNGEGYVCSVCSSHKVYREGSFDFLAAYVVPEEAWYILPAAKVVGKRSVSLCTPTGRYEKYREAWELLREAVGVEEDPPQVEAEPDGGADDGINQVCQEVLASVSRSQNPHSKFRKQTRNLEWGTRSK